MALKPCRECGASTSTEAQTCPQCGTPDPTKDKGAAPDLTKDKGAAPDPTKDKSAAPDLRKGTAGAPTKHRTSRWMIVGGSVFILAGVVIFFASAQPTPPPACPACLVCPACPNAGKSS